MVSTDGAGSDHRVLAALLAAVDPSLVPYVRTPREHRDLARDPRRDRYPDRDH